MVGREGFGVGYVESGTGEVLGEGVEEVVCMVMEGLWDVRFHPS